MEDLTACEKASQLGATIITKGYWISAEFPTHPSSMQFVNWLNDNVYPNLGSNPDGPPSFGWTVLYRVRS